jgi:hypothetical protein
MYGKDLLAAIYSHMLPTMVVQKKNHTKEINAKMQNAKCSDEEKRTERQQKRLSSS